MQRFVVLTACIFLFTVSFARADFYRWVDKDGKEFFTNDQRQIPQKYRNKASKVKLDKSRVSTEKKSVESGEKTVKSAATKTKTADVRSSDENVRKASGVN
jgi:hypothetical protein